MQLASPALPVGGFSYSEGLESAVEHGYITDEATAQHWLIDQLHISQSRSDLAVVAKAINAWRNNDLQKLQSLTQWILQTRETSEMRLQTEQMGRSLLEWLRNQTLVDELQLKTCLQLPPHLAPHICVGCCIHRFTHTRQPHRLCFFLGGKHGASISQSHTTGSTKWATNIGGTQFANPHRR